MAPYRIAMVTTIALTGLATAASVVALTLTAHGTAPMPLEWGTGPLTVAALPGSRTSRTAAAPTRSPRTACRG